MKGMDEIKALLCALLFVFSIDTSMADPVVWLDDNVSLHGRTIYFVSLVQNETGKTLSSDVTGLIASEMIQSLQKEGMTVLEKQDPSKDSITISSKLTDYEAGSAVGRWVLPGVGATVCVVRSILIDDKSGKTIGEIVNSGNVSAGGLFSIGAERNVPKQVAQEIAKQIIGLVKK